MKFNIQSKLLLSHLTAVSKVISNKNAYAILDNFLFELEGERLVVTGSDMETRMTTTIDVPGAEGSGRFAIDVKRMLNLLKELPDAGLTIEVDESTLDVSITYLNGSFNIVALNGDDYPLKAQSDGETQVLKLSSKDVCDGILHTLFAVGTDEMHPQFMGIFWDIKADGITFVASDSHKLVRYQKNNVTPNMERTFILPAKPASILSNVLDKAGKDEVVITIEDTSATFESGAYQLTCRFINGRYPNYNSVIPPDNDKVVVVDRLTLLNALRRVAIFANVGGLVKLDINPNEILLNAQDLDHSTRAEERIQCELEGNFSTEPQSFMGVEDKKASLLTMGFKHSDVIEVLNNIESDSVNIKLKDSARAGVFLPSTQVEGEELLILQMPMMI
ncbi:MAG: DNA polymerase III subunit beta [Muribaculaceae bacterium]|nr:DNA polymerase III subunit beta [Muribaculaceae bacterium]